MDVVKEKINPIVNMVNNFLVTGVLQDSKLE